MLLNIVIGSFLIVLTTGIHAGGMILAINTMRSKKGLLKQRLHLKRQFYSVGTIVLIMFFAALVEVLVWAITYLLLNAMDGFEQAFYFSMVTFTTLGYGDVLLEEQWRLLGSFEAANGTIMFGWTTAIVMAAVHHTYFSNQEH
jgi:hypothetical protein